MLQLDKTERLVYQPLGQRISAIENDFPYVVNPFNVIEYSEFLEKYSEELMTTTNKSILVSSENIYKNTIFLCCAKDVFAYSETTSLTSEITSKLYYPFLFRQNISSSESLLAEHQELIDKTDALLTEQLKKNIDRVQLLYDIFQNKTEELQYTEIGIKSISLEVHPRFALQIPIDIIFKILHATLEHPLIKYNPGKRQEKIYRLYANQISTNGKKIPYLNKPTIIKIIKSIGSERGVHVYIEQGHLDHPGGTTPPASMRNKQIVICSFNKNGVIHIQTAFNTALSVADTNTVLQSAIKPIMDTVNDYFEQSGYQIAEFNGIDKKNINIINMEYTAHIPLIKKLKLRKISPCLSTIFNIINEDINEGIVMRLKRVSNYNEMDSQEAFIIEKLNGGSRELAIIRGLVDNFELTEALGKRKVSRVYKFYAINSRRISTKKIQSKSKSRIFDDNNQRNSLRIWLPLLCLGLRILTILKTIPVYIDTLLRLSENPTSTTIPKEQIQLLCEAKKNGNYRR